MTAARNPTMARHALMRAPLVAVLAGLVLLAILSRAAPARAQDQPHARLFRPDDIGILEAPDRDMWQRPDEIMDVLNIADGSVVADVGAAAGWFTVRLARRVGPNGLVFAEDIQQPMLDAIAYRVSHEGLDNVVNVLGTAEDPRLPADLDAVLIVDVYAEVEDPVSLLTNVAAALKPQGRLGIVDFTRDGGGPGPEMERRVEAEKVIRDAEAAGLSLLSQETFLTYQFLLVFGLEPDAARRVQPER